MATTRKTRKTTEAPPPSSTLAAATVRDMVRQMLREAFTSHSRELEKHLNDINRRLTELENRS
mgnify:CR=1 FL=1